ncbi:hypothetical protein L7F22_005751 [Adiantum nelumboides]|nr:hypothetical protein [Adiantum nelumboides]
MRMPSVGNNLYFVTFIDDFSRFCWVYPLKEKSDVFAIFQHYVSMVENEIGCKVQTLRTDRGGEYMSGAFKDFLGKKGIKHQCTMPYTPQQNGVAERKNRSLMEMARCMLKAKSLPHKLWMEAVACAAHVLNRCPTRALKTITPYESWYDKKPSISYLRVFGCLAYAHIPQQLHGKLDDKAVKCIFVGYSSGSKGYRLYNPATNKIFEIRDVISTKTTTQPMVAFDVPHMQAQEVFEGFLPSFVENQESQQVDNFDQSFDQHVTPHDVEKIVREEQEVLREERTLPKLCSLDFITQALMGKKKEELEAADVLTKAIVATTGSPLPASKLEQPNGGEISQNGIWSFLATLQASINAQNQEIIRLATKCQTLESKNTHLEQIVEEHAKKITTLESSMETPPHVETPKTWTGVVAHALPNEGMLTLHAEGGDVIVDIADMRECKEREKRAQNLVIWGLIEKDDKSTLSLTTEVTEFFGKHFAMPDLPVFGARRLGKKREGGKARAILLDSIRVYLKRTTFYVNEDRTPMQQEERQKQQNERRKGGGSTIGNA